MKGKDVQHTIGVLSFDTKLDKTGFRVLEQQPGPNPYTTKKLLSEEHANEILSAYQQTITGKICLPKEVLDGIKSNNSGDDSPSVWMLKKAAHVLNTLLGNKRYLTFLADKEHVMH